MGQRLLVSFRCRPMKWQSSMNHIILEEINVADWKKRVMMWTQATRSPFIMGVIALIFVRCFLRFPTILPFYHMAEELFIRPCSVWKHAVSKPIKFEFRASELTSWKWWIKMLLLQKQSLPSYPPVWRLLEGHKWSIVCENRRFEGSAFPQPFVTLIFGKCDN